ncbi:hypothetical protein OF83DRAFT_369489 [Amylostereum chailletii]|nr:hypothetical protein OF83DRAFT_369489 [Amylostereum chailletii]
MITVSARIFHLFHLFHPIRVSVLPLFFFTPRHIFYTSPFSIFSIFFPGSLPSLFLFSHCSFLHRVTSSMRLHFPFFSPSPSAPSLSPSLRRVFYPLPTPSLLAFIS